MLAILKKFVVIYEQDRNFRLNRLFLYERKNNPLKFQRFYFECYGCATKNECEQKIPAM
jgi:hypothetical protein